MTHLLILEVKYLLPSILSPASPLVKRQDLYHPHFFKIIILDYQQIPNYKIYLLYMQYMSTKIFQIKNPS